MLVVKRDGSLSKFDENKIPSKVRKQVVDTIKTHDKVDTKTLSELVEKALIDEDLEEDAKRFALARIYNHVYGKGKWKEFDERDLLLTYNAIKVLEARYLLKNPETQRFIETPQMMFRRVARHIASIDPGYEDQFYEMMSTLKFLPNSPTLMNSGTKLGILSACFVLPVKDELSNGVDGIFDAVKAAAIIHKQGGGTGFDFSELRPKGDIVASTAGVASGPVSFMRIFDTSTDVVKQGGKRRGANMGILHVWHPDVFDFISSKSGKLKDVNLQNFNISVGVYDYFMKAVEKNEDVPLINPRNNPCIVKARNYMSEEWVQEAILDELENGPIYLDDSKIVTVDEALAISHDAQFVNARKLFNEIVKGAWDSGDPGLVFIDEINRRHPTWHVGKIQATNPCGEEPLLPWESCNLGSINLEKFVVDGKIDVEGLKKTIYLAVRFLDDVIDVNKYPLPELEAAAKRTRKIGLGVMGFARMLIRLGIPYDSQEAISLAFKLALFMYYHALKASIELAKERGPFPAFDPRLYKIVRGDASLFKNVVGIEIRGFEYLDVDDKKFDELEEEIRTYGIRNATVLSIAPTGTISIIAGTSSSIEPLFDLAFIRKVSIGEFLEVDPLFKEYLKKRGMYNKTVLDQVLSHGFHDPLFKTAHDVDPIYHLAIQAAWQQWVDAGVSKTINLRNEEPVETVEKVYLTAWKLGLKGITVYRDRSKSVQVLNKITSMRMKEPVPLTYAGGCKTCEV